MGWFFALYLFAMNVPISMNKNIFILTTALFISCFSFAQKEKIKGDKNVKIERTDLDAFHTIIITEDLDIEIIEGSKSSVEVEADENLHEVVKFNVRDSILNVETTHNISSKKKLEIKLRYQNCLKNIQLIGDAVVRSNTPVDVSSLSLKTADNSKAYLTVKSHDFELSGSGRSKVKLNLTASNTKLVLSDNSYLISLIYSEEFAADLYQRADVVIEGTSKSALIRTDNSAQFKGKDFTIDNCTVLSETASDAHLEVLNSVTIDATGDSAIYLYGSPKITINKFTDTVKLEKKLK